MISLLQTAINDSGNNYDDDDGGADDDGGDDIAGAVDAYADLEEPLGRFCLVYCVDVVEE